MLYWLQWYCTQYTTSVNLVDADVNTRPASYRQEQALATKQRIATAAQELFARDGYGATSMESIARAAGVGTRTVYASFGAKREILNLICERWLERAHARELAGEVLAEPDPSARLAGAAHWLTVLYSTDFDVVRILDAAQDEDAETQALLRSKLRGRNRVMDGLIASVEPVLRLPLRDAQAIYRSLAASGVYQELVVNSGWAPARFEDWVRDTLTAQLL